MTFTRIRHTQSGGWSNRNVTNESFAASLATFCTDAYQRRFETSTDNWEVNMVTGVIRYLDEVWSYIGHMDDSGRFVADAKENSDCCDNGLFFNGGGTLNGVFTGTIGVCFSCGGKGYRTPSDMRRNRTYWSHN